MQGWVKFHRKIEEWEWYTDPNTFRLFFHLVLKANHKPKKWRGVDVNKGQLITSRDKLAEQLSLTPQQIRTSLTKLKSTNEITIKSTNKYTLVTIENYCLYQTKDEETTSKTTSNAPNEQPSNNQQVTTNKNDKNKKKKEYTNEFEELYSIYPNSKAKQDTFNNYNKRLKEYTHEQLIKSVKAYSKHVEKNNITFIYSSNNFFGNKGYFEDWVKVETEKPKVILKPKELDWDNVGD